MWVGGTPLISFNFPSYKGMAAQAARKQIIHIYKSAIDINKFESTSTISASDIDGDSDLDLFLGTRLNTGSYGIKTQNYIQLTWMIIISISG